MLTKSSHTVNFKRHKKREEVGIGYKKHVIGEIKLYRIKKVTNCTTKQDTGGITSQNEKQEKKEERISENLVAEICHLQDKTSEDIKKMVIKWFL